LDVITASVITGLGAAVVAGGSTLAGVLLTQRSSRQQQASALRAQERKDQMAQDEVRRYRNHERRINAAAQYIAALNAFRRAVNDLDPKNSESVGQATAAARASADAGSLVDLYFSKSVHERSAVLAAAMFAHELAALDVHVVAGLSGDFVVAGLPDRRRGACRRVSGPDGCRGRVRRVGRQAPRLPLAAAR
jgi:hypothetical protein